MDPNELDNLIEANDERLLSEYGAHLRARNAAHTARLASQIGRAALVELRSTPARATRASWVSFADALLGGRSGFALAGAMLALAVVALVYVVYGGRPSAPEILATASSAGIQVSAQHTGPFGLTWHMPLAVNQVAALTQGDEIQTDGSTTVTLTFATGTQSVIGPNSLARIESSSPLAVRMLNGDIANQVKPATVAGVPAFEVITARGLYISRGTVYNVRVANAGDRIRTREGSVAVRTARSEQIVAGGQEADISDSGLITRHLSAPDVVLTLSNGQIVYGGDSVTTNVLQATAQIATAAGASVEGDWIAAGSSVPVTVTRPIQANTTGEATLPVHLPTRDGTYQLTFIVTDTSGQKLGSAVSRPITIVVNRMPPSLFNLTQPPNNSATSSPVQIVGITEPGTTMTVNGSPVIVQNDGHFSLSLPLKAGPNAVVFIVTDAAGNSLRVEETITLVR